LKALCLEGARKRNLRVSSAGNASPKSVLNERPTFLELELSAIIVAKKVGAVVPCIVIGIECRVMHLNRMHAMSNKLVSDGLIGPSLAAGAQSDREYGGKDFHRPSSDSAPARRGVLRPASAQP
jgi:hypothetical protein